MAKKVLTISIAAYNVEQYIEQCVSSLIVDDVIDKLEIFIVDDGGTDNTCSKIEKYEKEFPNSIFIVHKENGGYGSTVNYSIEHATGKYFKLLDGDDWFDTNSISKYIYELENTECDLIITDYFEGADKDSLKLVDSGSGAINVDKIDNMKYLIGHWAITYRLELLKEVGLLLPEHCLYTDKCYSTIPMNHVRTIKALNLPLYCYRVGRAGQSISTESRIKHADDYMQVCRLLCQYVENTPKVSDYVKRHVANDYRITVKTLLLSGFDENNLRNLATFEKEMATVSPIVFYLAGLKNTKTGVLIAYLRRINYKRPILFRFLPINKWLF